MSSRFAALLLTCLTLVDLGACTHRSRRLASSCDDGTQCDSGVCYQGHCAQPCVTDTQCGTQLCLDSVCQDKTAVCEDSNPCTIGGWIQGKCNPHIGDVTCEHLDSECSVGVCNPKSTAQDPCVTNARQEVLGQFCGTQAANKTYVCAAGGPNKNGCKCALWQTRIAPPALAAGEAPVPGRLGGAAKADVGVLAVGSLQAADRRVAWAVRMDGSGVPRVSVPVLAGEGVLDQTLNRVAVAPLGAGGWLAVGAAGKPSQGWIVRIAQDVQDGNGAWQLTAPWQKAVVPIAGTAGVLRDVTLAPDGTWLAVGTATSSQGVDLPWLVRVDAKGTIVAQDTLALPGGATAAFLTGVAPLGAGFVAVGEASTVGGKRGWLLRLDTAGKVVTQQVIMPSEVKAKVKEGSLQGVTVSPLGKGAAFGWTTLEDGSQDGWIVEFDGQAVPQWDASIVVQGHVAWVAGALTADGKWLTAGTIAAGTQGYAASVGKDAVAPGYTPDAQELVAVTQVEGGFMLVGNSPGLGGKPAGGWMLRFAQSPVDAGGPDGSTPAKCDGP
jgi:hypothetical protein